MHMQPPLVDLAVRAQPAQSESVNAVTLLGHSCHENSDTSRGLPINYRPILRNLRMLDRRGVAMSRAASFTA